MKALDFEVRGKAPLLMHNGQLANPMNSFAKAMKVITSKRPKTDADLIRLAELEWKGSLYLKGGEPCLPAGIIEATLTAAARKKRKGKQAGYGLMVLEDSALEYDGPTDIEMLWEDPQFRLTTGVRIGKNRIMRTRPKFDDWSVSLSILFDPGVFNPEQIIEFVEIAGKQVGFCDWRPRYGRFEIVDQSEVYDREI